MKEGGKSIYREGLEKKQIAIGGAIEFGRSGHRESSPCLGSKEVENLWGTLGYR